MPHYKNPITNTVYFYTVQERKTLGSNELVEMTDGEVEEYVAAFNSVTSPYKNISSLEFLKMLEPERKSIKQATMVDIDLAILYEDIVAAQHVTYSDHRIEEGLSMLVEKGLLTDDRKTEIISQMKE